MGLIVLRLPEEINIRLSLLAKKTGRTKSYYAKQAILEHLSELEALYLAEERLLDIAKGKTKTISIEEVMKENGMVVRS